MPGTSRDSRTAVKNGKTQRVFVETKTIDNEPKQKSKETVRTWSRYIHKILKEVHQDNTSISMEAMAIMNHLINDLFEKFAMEASQLAKRNNRKTIQLEDIHTAVKLLVPEELCRHAIAAGQKALHNYNCSMERG